MTKGIHHITAIASDATENVEFYSKILGLRLVKKTVNQDDVSTYHLFFGDKLGDPGMDLTFFIFKPPVQGTRGNGLVTNISLAVPEQSLQFWQERLDEYKVKHEGITARFHKQRILFFDEDNQQLELVGVPRNELEEHPNLWVPKDIPQEHVIRNFYSATLSVISKETIEPVLEHVFGYEHVFTEEHMHLYTLPNSKRANVLEVHERPSSPVGVNAAGTVHHIAFRAKDEEEQLKMREKVMEAGLFPTEVIDRFYFKSVYFQAPAGILFEIATEGPGFTADEAEGDLGKKLALPPFLEPERDAIEANLPSI